MKFRIVENVLNEEKYHRVEFTYNDNGTTKNDFIYLILNNNQQIDKSDSNGVVRKLFSTGNVDGHESVDKNWKDIVTNASVNITKIVPNVDKKEAMKNQLHLLVTTNSSLRGKSKRRFVKEASNDGVFKEYKNYKCYLHHPEGNETAVDPRINSGILYKGNSNLPNSMHQILHELNVDPRTLGSTSDIPVVVYDQSISKFVVRKIKITITK